MEAKKTQVSAIVTAGEWDIMGGLVPMCTVSRDERVTAATRLTSFS